MHICRNKRHRYSQKDNSRGGHHCHIRQGGGEEEVSHQKQGAAVQATTGLMVIAGAVLRDWRFQRETISVLLLQYKYPYIKRSPYNLFMDNISNSSKTQSWLNTISSNTAKTKCFFDKF